MIAPCAELCAEDVGRGGGIRTPDPLVPNQMRYQTALRPDGYYQIIAGGGARD